MTNTFLDQVVIISGGLGDIGIAIARAFAREGASIAVGDIKSPDAAEGMLAEMKRT